MSNYPKRMQGESVASYVHDKNNWIRSRRGQAPLPPPPGAVPSRTQELQQKLREEQELKAHGELDD